MCRANDLEEYDDSYGLPIGISAKIERIKFNKDYCKLYFDNNDGTCNNLIKPKGLRQGPKWIEDEINDIREKDVPEIIDIFKILAWKIGKIDYKKSKETKNIEYVSGWVIGKSIQTSKNPISWDEYEDYAQVIITIWSDYRNATINVDAAWKKLVDLATEIHQDAMKGIGSVILVTLLFFITGGDYPIYDRFAMSSLIAWKLDQQGITLPTGTIINGCGLPPKEKPNELKTLLTCGKYADYIQLLKSFCLKEYGKEDIWKKERSVDQALYVYGHFYDARY